MVGPAITGLGRCCKGNGGRITWVDATIGIHYAVFAMNAMPDLNQLALFVQVVQAGSFAEASRRFRFAAMSDFDAATTMAARDNAANAERGASAIKIPDDIRAFLQKFDGAVLQGTTDAVNQFIELGNLRKFAQSLVVRKPAIWVTEAIRTEEWDANRIAVDVTLKIKIEGKDYAGRAVYVISRANGKMLLSEVPVFDVK